MILVALARRALGEAAVARIGVLRPLGAAGVDLAAVEAGALVLVRQQIIGRRDLLEARLGLFVAGVEIGMMPLGELAIGGADLLLARILGDAEHLVGVSRSHGKWTWSLPPCIWGLFDLRQLLIGMERRRRRQGPFERRG